jgi:hypothetical protein
MLVQFDAANPEPVVPSAYPSASKLKDGIIDGTYTMAYKENKTNLWFYVTEVLSWQSSHRDGMWDFRLADTTMLVERELCCKAIVKVSAPHELGSEIKGHGPGIYTVGEAMNNRSWVRMLV